MTEMIQHVERSDGDIVVRVAGEIDLSRSPEFHQALVDFCSEKPRRLILNMSGVEYIDSSGVGTLVEVFRRLKKDHRTMVLVSPSERVSGVLEITKLDQFFTIVATEREAMQT